MKKIFFLLVVFLIYVSTTFAQQVTGAYLMNYTGAEKPSLAKVEINRGFEQGVTLSYARYLGLYNQLSLNYIGGCRINHYLFAGLGTGLDFEAKHNGCVIMNDSGYLPAQIVSVPLYLHLRAYLMKTRWAPFLAFSGGCRFSSPKEVEYSYWAYVGSDYVQVSGNMQYGVLRGLLDVMLGVNYQYSKDLTFNIQAGCAAYNVPCYIYGRYDYIMKEDLAHGFVIKFGVTF